MHSQLPIICAVCVLYLVSFRQVGAWSPSDDLRQHLSDTSYFTSRSQFLKALQSACLLTASLTYSKPAFGSEESGGTSVNEDSFSAKIKSSLKAPSEDRPKIELPTIPSSATMEPEPNSLFSKYIQTTPASQKPGTLPPPTNVQVLIALANPQMPPLSTDILVVQVFDQPTGSDGSKQLLGGAKIPMSKIRRFPVQLSLTSQNAKVSADAWSQASTSHDFQIVASICPESTLKDPQTLCGIGSTSKDSTVTSSYSLQGTTTSKLLKQLPGLDKDILAANGGVRAPASLTLFSVP